MRVDTANLKVATISAFAVVLLAGGCASSSVENAASPGVQTPTETQDTAVITNETVEQTPDAGAATEEDAEPSELVAPDLTPNLMLYLPDQSDHRVVENAYLLTRGRTPRSGGPFLYSIDDLRNTPHRVEAKTNILEDRLRDYNGTDHLSISYPELFNEDGGQLHVICGGLYIAGELPGTPLARGEKTLARLDPSTLEVRWTTTDPLWLALAVSNAISHHENIYGDYYSFGDYYCSSPLNGSNHVFFKPEISADRSQEEAPGEEVETTAEPRYVVLSTADGELVETIPREANVPFDDYYLDTGKSFKRAEISSQTVERVQATYGFDQLPRFILDIRTDTLSNGEAIQHRSCYADQCVGWIPSTGYVVLLDSQDNLVNAWTPDDLNLKAKGVSELSFTPLGFFIDGGDTMMVFNPGPAVE